MDLLKSCVPVGLPENPEEKPPRALLRVLSRVLSSNWDALTGVLLRVENKRESTLGTLGANLGTRKRDHYEMSLFSGGMSSL